MVFQLTINTETKKIYCLIELFYYLSKFSHLNTNIQSHQKYYSSPSYTLRESKYYMKICMLLCLSINNATYSKFQRISSLFQNITPQISLFLRFLTHSLICYLIKKGSFKPTIHQILYT